MFVIVIIIMESIYIALFHTHALSALTLIIIITMKNLKSNLILSQLPRNNDNIVNNNTPRTSTVRLPVRHSELAF